MNFDPELPIPPGGLDHVLRSWIGRGDFIDVLSRIPLDDVSNEWRPADVVARAKWVSFLVVEPYLLTLPTTIDEWLDSLPAMSNMSAATAAGPFGAPDWPRTLLRFGWPPSQFVVRQRDRTSDQQLVLTMCWLLRNLVDLAESAKKIDPDADVKAARQLLAARLMIERLGSEGIRPSPPDLLVIEREGRIWRRVAACARNVIALEQAANLSQALMEPRAGLRPTLFHLGVLGEVLLSISSNGGKIVSVNPLASASGRENYHVEVNGIVWHLWMEGGAVWSRYKWNSPYKSTSSVLRSRPKPLSPDIVLIAPGQAAFVIECKYSADSDYIARRGLAQVALYLSEISNHCPRVEGCVVPPASQLDVGRMDEYGLGSMGIMSPNTVGERVWRFMQAN